MYSKEEAFQIRKKFWTSFGQYMKLQTSASGLEINWINYKTGIKGLQLKTDADNKSARIAIEMTQNDREIQELMFEQFEEFQVVFEGELGSDWVSYKSEAEQSGNQMASIEVRLENLSMFKVEDSPSIISFFKDDSLGWDSFWDDVKDSFEFFK